MKRVSAVIVMSGLIAGCVSPGDMRAKAPLLEVSGSKNAKTVAGCIADGWERNANIMRVGSRPTSKGYSVWLEGRVAGGTDTSVLVDVNETPNGSKTVFYSNRLFGDDKFISIVKDCQA